MWCWIQGQVHMIHRSKTNLRLLTISLALVTISSLLVLDRLDLDINNHQTKLNKIQLTSIRWFRSKTETLEIKERPSYKLFKCTKTRQTITQMLCSAQLQIVLVIKKLPLKPNSLSNRSLTCVKKGDTNRAWGTLWPRRSRKRAIKLLWWIKQIKHTNLGLLGLSIWSRLRTQLVLIPQHKGSPILRSSKTRCQALEAITMMKSLP